MEKNTNVINLYVPILGKCSFQVFTNRDEDVLPAQEMEDEDVVELVLPRVEAVRRLLVHVHLQLHLNLLSCTQITQHCYTDPDPNPDPLVRGLNTDPSITKQK